MFSRKRLELAGRAAWVPVALCAVLVLLFLLAQYVLGSDVEQIAENMFITVVLVIGLQVFSGNSGVLSFGHISFMAIGAYSSALLTIPPPLKHATFTSMPGFMKWILDADLGVVESTLIAGACAAIFALIVATPIVRLAGVSAGIATLALLVIVYTFNIQTTAITRGTSTMIGVPATTTMSSAMIWSLLAVVAAFIFQASRHGLRLRATRENDGAARSVGINVPFERGIAWVVSAFFMGVGGALYGHYVIAFSAGEFYFDITFITIMMLVIGGLTSVSGAVIGTVFVSIVQELLRRLENGPLDGSLPGLTEVVLAIILLLVLILRRRGLTGGHELPWPGDWNMPRWLGARREPADAAVADGASLQEAPAAARPTDSQ